MSSVQLCDDVWPIIGKLLPIEDRISLCQVNAEFGKLFRPLLAESAEELKYALKCASLKGDRNLVDYLITIGGTDWGKYEWTCGMLSAVLGGHQELVEFYINNKGVTDRNEMGLTNAALGGHRGLVDFFISRGAKDWVSGFMNALRGGHRELAGYFGVLIATSTPA